MDKFFSGQAQVKRAPRPAAKDEESDEAVDVYTAKQVPKGVVLGKDGKP